MKATLLLLAALALSACTSGKGVPKNSSADPSSHRYNVVISWTASGGNPDGYSVEVSRGGGSFAVEATTTGTSVTLHNMISTVPCVVRVRAYNPGGYGPYASVSFTPW